MNLQLSIWRNASSSTLCPGVQSGNHLEMDFMEGYFGQQVVPDCYHDPKKWWEVMDRTTGQAVPASTVGADRGVHAGRFWRWQ